MAGFTTGGPPPGMPVASTGARPPPMTFTVPDAPEPAPTMTLGVPATCGPSDSTRPPGPTFQHTRRGDQCGAVGDEAPGRRDDRVAAWHKRAVADDDLRRGFSGAAQVDRQRTVGALGADLQPLLAEHIAAAGHQSGAAAAGHQVGDGAAGRDAVAEPDAADRNSGLANSIQAGDQAALVFDGQAAVAGTAGIDATAGADDRTRIANRDAAAGAAADRQGVVQCLVGGACEHRPALADRECASAEPAYRDALAVGVKFGALSADIHLAAGRARGGAADCAADAAVGVSDEHHIGVGRIVDLNQPARADVERTGSAVYRSADGCSGTDGQTAARENRAAVIDVQAAVGAVVANVHIPIGRIVDQEAARGHGRIAGAADAAHRPGAPIPDADTAAVGAGIVQHHGPVILDQQRAGAASAHDDEAVGGENRTWIGDGNDAAAVVAVGTNAERIELAGISRPDDNRAALRDGKVAVAGGIGWARIV